MKKLILYPNSPKCQIYDVINGIMGCKHWNYGHCLHINFGHNSKCPLGLKSKRKRNPSQSYFRHFDIDKEEEMKKIRNGS